MEHTRKKSWGEISSPNSTDDYALTFQKMATDAFISVIEKENKILASRLKHILEIQTGTERPSRKIQYLTLWNHLSEQEQLELASAHAKINDIQRRVRKIAISQQFHKFQENNPTTADVFSYVLEKFREKNIPAETVQEFIDTNAIAQFSLTSHPTNPTTVDYTITGLEFETLLTKKNVKVTELEAAFKKLYNTPIVGKKKNQEDEMRETIAIADNAYHALIPTRNNFQKALEKTGYSQRVAIKKPLFKLDTWSTGDGDGNSNATPESLKNGIESLKSRIKALYKQDLANILPELPKGTKLSPWLADLRYRSPKQFVHALQSLQTIKDLQKPTIQKIDDLIYKVKTFGFHFAKIDIRHNADDIMETIGALAKKAGLTHGTFEEWLNNPDTINKLIEAGKQNLGNETANRIFKRLQIIAKHPEMSDKLIIAECKGTEHGIAALLLLKASGNKVAERGATMDLVTLSESVPDLKDIQAVQIGLLKNPFYRKHVEYRGNQILTMIAKSDTVRRSGIGAEYSQEKAVENLYALQHHFPEIHVRIFNGGGAALQRGGGRLTETAYNHSRMAIAAGIKKMLPSTLTIQGHQMQILLSPGVTAKANLEAFVAQNLYAAARVAGAVDLRKYPKNVDPKIALHDRELEATTSLAVFDKLIKNQSFNKLFETGPYVPVEFGNVSSRPSKRDSSQTQKDPTPIEIIGKNPQVTERRAIGVERLCAHSGTFFMTILSKLEGLKEIDKLGKTGHGLTHLHNMYLGSKAAADSIRNTAIAIYMTDYPNAWDMLLKEKRPSEEHIQKLAYQFNPNTENSPEVTLAYLDHYTFETAKLVYEAVLGKKPDTKFTPKNILQEAWPELAKEVESRDLGAEFEKVIEAKLVNDFNHNLNKSITLNQQRITQAIYAGGDVINAPTGLLNALTRKEPDKAQPMSFRKEIIANQLKVPAVLQAMAGHTITV